MFVNRDFRRAFLGCQQNDFVIKSDFRILFFSIENEENQECRDDREYDGQHNLDTVGYAFFRSLIRLICMGFRGGRMGFRVGFLIGRARSRIGGMGRGLGELR